MLKRLRLKGDDDLLKRGYALTFAALFALAAGAVLVLGGCSQDQVANTKCMFQGHSSGSAGYEQCMHRYAPGLIFPDQAAFGRAPKPHDGKCHNVSPTLAECDPVD